MDSTLEKKRFYLALFLSFCIVAMIWLVFLADWAFDLALFRFGIIPREARGLMGVILAPLIHGGPGHVFANTLPVFILLSFHFYFNPENAPKQFFLIWIFSGVLLWAGGRGGTAHVGASSWIYALSAFLFFRGLLLGNISALVVSVIVVFLYGSLIWGVFPLEEKISWEGHLFGAVSGTLFAFYYFFPTRSKSEITEEPESELWNPGHFENFIREESRSNTLKDPQNEKQTKYYQENRDKNTGKGIRRLF